MHEGKYWRVHNSQLYVNRRRNIFTVVHCFYSTGVYDTAINNLGVRYIVKGMYHENITTFCTKENIGSVHNCVYSKSMHISTVAHCFYSKGVYDPAINNFGVSYTVM